MGAALPRPTLSRFLRRLLRASLATAAMTRSDARKDARAELHSHTDRSDGSLSPEELVAAARETGLVALAVTDHDTMAGVAPARQAAADTSLELIAGIEISSHIDDKEVHILGLFVDEGSRALRRVAARNRDHRRTRGRAIVGRLADEGVELDADALEARAQGGSLGRPHIAAALVEAGHVESFDEAFRRYLGIGRPAFVAKETVPAVEAIEAVHRAGGVAILAHPASSRVPEDKIALLAGAGLDGCEISHPKHSRRQQNELRLLASRLGLLPTSGSDFHGPGRGDTPLGAHAAPLEWLEALRDRAHRYRDGNEHRTRTSPVGERQEDPSV